MTQVSPDDLVRLIGTQQIELSVMSRRLAELQQENQSLHAKLKELMPVPE